MASKNNKAKGIGLGALLLAVPVVALFEGNYLTTYVDPVGIPTVCMGETDKEITMQGRFTEEQCYILLGASLQRTALEVSPCIKAELHSHEAAAVLSWAYNVGSGAACGSTLVRKINAGESSTAWCPELKRWVYAGGKKLRGLEKRREAEYKMCMGQITEYK